MPVIRNIELKIDSSDVACHYTSVHSNQQTEILKISSELVEDIYTLHLLEPSISYQIYNVKAITKENLVIDDVGTIEGSIFFDVMEQASKVAVVACTIGSGLEKAIQDYFLDNEPLRGLLLDNIANAAVDALTREVCGMLATYALSCGYQSGSPISPGMQGFPLSAQRKILKMAHALEGGIYLTPSGVMQPLKSLSLVIGIGNMMDRWSAAQECARCNLHDTCRHRRRG